MLAKRVLNKKYLEIKNERNLHFHALVWKQCMSVLQKYLPWNDFLHVSVLECYRHHWNQDNCSAFYDCLKVHIGYTWLDLKSRLPCGFTKGKLELRFFKMRQISFPDDHPWPGRKCNPCKKPPKSTNQSTWSFLSKP